MIWKREPAMILAVVQAIIALAISFGFGLSPEQVGSILAVTAAVLGLVVRSQVTPTSKNATDVDMPAETE